MDEPRKKRGFAVMPEALKRQIQSAAGKRAHEIGAAHEFTSEEATEAGRKGGLKVSEDREYMAEIGRKGAAARRLKRADKA